MKLIAGFKLFKGILLLIVGAGVLTFVNKDIEELTMHWVSVLRADPDNKIIHWVLVKLWNLDDRKLQQISAGSFFYAAMLLTEGIGLLYRKRWAEYFTVIATGSFIPLEVYELFRHVTPAKIIVIVVNVLIVVYLVRLIRAQRHGEHA
jgi:uncharacterized membrane protein (DUF2068 family)